MRIGIRKIGLDVVDWRPVGKVRARNIENRTVFCVQLDACQLHARQPDRVRAERRARCKHAHARLSPELRRRDRGRPQPVFNPVEVPQQPQMTPLLNAPQTVRVAEFRLEDDLRNQRVCQPRLARDAEFGWKIRVDAGNVLHGKPPVTAFRYHITSAEKCKILLLFLKNGVEYPRDQVYPDIRRDRHE